jgi:magnesium-transporting ATPase (P-type)
MRKVSRKIINAMTNARESDLQNGKDFAENSTFDAFYQRMFDRDIYLHVSEISVAMLGVCLTGVSILNVDQENTTSNSSFGIDDLLAFDSIVFLIAYLMSYWVVRVMTKNDRNVRKIGNIANAIFLVGMILMAIVCVSIVQQSDYVPRKLIFK